MSKSLLEDGPNKLSTSEEKNLSKNVANLSLIATPNENNVVGCSKNKSYAKTSYRKQDKDMATNRDRNGFIKENSRNKYRSCSSEEPPDWKPPPDVLADLERENIFLLKKKSARFPKAKYFCRSCEYHCDTVEICIRHSLDARHVHMKELKVLDNVLRNFPPPTEDQTESINELIKSVALAQSITEEEVKLRKEIKNELEKLLVEVVPDTGLEINGSTLSGFALKSSNLDLDVIVPDDIKPATALLAIQKIIEKDKRYSNIVNELSSSYPCLSFTQQASGTRMVVGVSSPPSRNTNILFSHYNSLDPRVKPLVVAFRYWAKLCGIDNQHKGSLPAHCFPLMAIHFLQHVSQPVLPVLHTLNQTTEPDHYLKPNELNPPWKSLNTSSLGKLWIDLFNFYSVSFKMAVYTINIRTLDPVTRKDKTWGKRIAIEDPFQSKRNLTRSVSSPSVFDYITNRIKTTYKYFATPQLHFGGLYTQVERETKKASSVTALFPDSYNENIDTECLMSKDKALFRIDDADDEEIYEEEDDSTYEEMEDYDELKIGEVKATEEFEEKSSSPVEKSPSSHSSLKGSSNDSSVEEELTLLSDIKSTIELISYKVAKALMGQISKEAFQYSFEEINFTCGKKVPLFCSACRKTGHDKTACKEHELPPLKSLPVLTSQYYKILTKIFQDLQNECAPTIKEIKDRDYIVGDLESFIRLSFHGATLKLFGSSANGFGFGHSDLDICLTFEGHPTGENFNYIKVIEEIAERLKKFKPVRQVLAITTAKVPIVKFVVRTGPRMQLEADLSLYNTLALQNTQLLSTYANIDPRVKVLGYAMKYFAKLCDIGDASRGSLSSYAYILMVIHYLQQCKPPVVPVLQKLYDPTKNPPQRLIDGWNAWFYSDLKNLPKVWKDYGKNKQSIGELWVNMFRYYTEIFNWKDNVVTIGQMQPLSRLMKLWTTQCIAIEDPFDLSHNLGAGLSRKMNTYIMKAFIRGREMFGSGYEAPPINQGYRDLVEYMFDTHQLTDGAPPNDRGCRLCGKIGHMVKECPRKRKHDPKKDMNKENWKLSDDKVPVEVAKKETEQLLPNLNSKGPSAQDRILQNLPTDLVATEFLTKSKMICGDGPTHVSASPVINWNADGAGIQDVQMHLRKFNFTNVHSLSEPPKTFIDPSMLFLMANKFGGGTIQLPGSPPVNLNPVCPSNIPSSSPVSPISSCSPPFYSQFAHIQKQNEFSQLADKSVIIPPPGFSQTCSAIEKPTLMHSSDNTTPLRSMAINFPDSTISISTPISSNAFETLCNQKESVLQALNAHQQHQQMMHERQHQLFLHQQQQIRIQEQQHHARIQEQQQQYLFQLNQQQMQMKIPQQPNAKEIPSYHQFHGNHSHQMQDKPSMDGNAFISHLMAQVPTGVVSPKLPGLPPPSLGSTTLSQLNYSKPTPIPKHIPSQHQFNPHSQQNYPDLTPNENSFQLKPSNPEEMRAFAESHQGFHEDGSPGQISENSPTADLTFLQNLAVSPPRNQTPSGGPNPVFSSDQLFMERDLRDKF